MKLERHRWLKSLWFILCSVLSSLTALFLIPATGDFRYSIKCSYSLLAIFSLEHAANAISIGKSATARAISVGESRYSTWCEKYPKQNFYKLYTDEVIAKMACSSRVPWSAYIIFPVGTFLYSSWTILVLVTWCRRLPTLTICKRSNGVCIVPIIPC